MSFVDLFSCWGSPIQSCYVYLRFVGSQPRSCMCCFIFFGRYFSRNLRSTSADLNLFYLLASFPGAWNGLAHSIPPILVSSVAGQAQRVLSLVTGHGHSFMNYFTRRMISYVTHNQNQRHIESSYTESSAIFSTLIHPIQPPQMRPRICRLHLIVFCPNSSR